MAKNKSSIHIGVDSRDGGARATPGAVAAIYPCPFSKGHAIPVKQAWLLLKVFLGYRLLLAGLFITMFYSHLGTTVLGSHDTVLFGYSTNIYLILTLFSAVCIFGRLTGYTVQAQTFIFTDIVIITLIMHALGGITSGVGILLAVSIASGGLLIGGRCAMLFAAIASLAILAEQIYAIQTHSFADSSFTYAGMLGASFFAIALLSHVLARRTEETVALARQQQKTIYQLEELNQYIIQHLQSGIIIADKNRQIQMSNSAALNLAQLESMPGNLDQISEDLALAFSLWLHDPGQDFVLLPVPGQPEIPVRFMLLPTEQEVLHMLILENSALYNQRLQQSKLASLGRLTASIAHEVRNPLSAISHAGQLLSENPELSRQDLRLTEIIQTNSRRVNQIIEDILQLSRRNASNRKKINLDHWLNDYLHCFILEHNLPPATFSKCIEPVPLYALIDPAHLKQILDNLCLNALKYGHPELKPITLSARQLEQAPCLEIIDAGSGIDPEQQKHLFEPFFTTSANGTGLGLYISRELAELNQAQLSYHLTETGKSCFRLCLTNAEQTIIAL